MKTKIYATDEGFGPLIRQSAIVKEIRVLEPDLEVEVQSHLHIKEAGWVFEDVTLTNRYNNITWHKHPDGSPDVERIRVSYADYSERSDAFIARELETFQADFVISDFVYEAFEVARLEHVPSFGVAHFTWDWFFSELRPAPLSEATLGRMRRFAELADVLYFPPFTPMAVRQRYAHKAHDVPLVVRKHVSRLTNGLSGDKFKVLVVDSGSKVLQRQMEAALSQAHLLSDEYRFFVPGESGVERENVIKIREKELLIDHVPHVDLVIARAGFNTISECIAFRTPMLLVGHAANPEIRMNISRLKDTGLASFVSLEDLTGSLPTFLPRFLAHEYKHILKAMMDHQIETHGARVIAEDILERVERAKVRGKAAVQAISGRKHRSGVSAGGSVAAGAGDNEPAPLSDQTVKRTDN